MSVCSITNSHTPTHPYTRLHILGDPKHSSELFLDLFPSGRINALISLFLLRVCRGLYFPAASVRLHLLRPQNSHLPPLSVLPAFSRRLSVGKYGRSFRPGELYLRDPSPLLHLRPNSSLLFSRHHFLPRFFLIYPVSGFRTSPGAPILAAPPVVMNDGADG